MNYIRIKQWLTDLRSGRFQQFRGEYQSGTSYCALGVLVRDELADHGMRSISRDIIDALGDEEAMSEGGLVYQVMEMNDDKGASFAEIADWVEATFCPAAILVERLSRLPFEEEDEEEEIPTVASL